MSDDCGPAAISCRLDASEMPARVEAWRDLLGRAEARTAIDGGIRISLPPGLAGRVAELAAAEKACCPFFDFVIRIGVDAVLLEVSAPADAMAVVEAFFGAPD